MSKPAGAKNAFPDSCPACGGRRMGKVGLDQYFCWDCHVQFSSGTQRRRVWQIADDGSLVPHAASAAACGETGGREDLVRGSTETGGTTPAGETRR